MDTPADLENLLRWLGPDTETGGQRYVELRQKLIVLFECRGCENADELADETLDRTARVILRPGFTFEGNPIAYLRGVARNVCMESRRKVRPVSQELLPELHETIPGNLSRVSEIEPLFACLDECLERLAEDRRSLLLRYYQGQKSAKIDGRLRLAQERGLELNALRIQVFRLRNVVRQCVERCATSREISRPV